jgi:diacylglycerol O-acyltransferase / wax synthase
MTQNGPSRSLKPVDAMWLNMESAIGTILIGGLLLFDAPVVFGRLRDQMAGRLPLVERLRQRPRLSSLPLTLPTWEPAPDFNLDDYLHHSELPPPGEWPQLSGFIEDLLATPLPPERPPWQMHLIEHYGSGSALVVCLSHTIADGFAAMHMFEALTDAAPAATAAEAPAAAAPIRPARPTAGLLGEVAAGARNAGEAALRLPFRLVRDIINVARHPAATLAAADWQLGEAQNLVEYALRPPDPRPAPDGISDRATCIAAAEPLPLAEVKAVAHAQNATVNDVLAATVAGALRRYLASLGVAVDGLKLHAAMPYNLRSDERRGELGNGFTIALLPLPVGIANPGARVRAVQNRMAVVKKHPALPASYALVGAASLLPAPLSRRAMRFALSKITLVLTNVRGLPEARYLAGQRIARILFWVPTSGLLTLVVSIISYAGQVSVCFDGAPHVVPDLNALPAHFAAAWSDLKAVSAALQPRDL